MQQVTTSAIPGSSNRVPLIVGVWLAFGTSLAFAGAFGAVPQLAPAFILTSTLGWAIAYARGAAVRQWADALPMRVLIAGHAVRLPIGVAFLWDESRGQLTPLFAQRAGWGDIAVGAVAIVVALVAWQRRRVVRAFALFGLIDIVVVVATGMYLLFIARDPLMLGAIERNPYPLLPLAVVPTVIVTHLLMLARTRVAGANGRSRATVGSRRPSVKRRVLQVLVGLVGVVVATLVGLVVYVQVAYRVNYPDTPLPAIVARTDQATLARGEYLVHAVAHCSTCHGPRENLVGRTFDVTAPLVGGYTWDFGWFGSFTARNLTPHETGIASLSDGQLARAIRHGVDARGKLSPMMRLSVGPMSDEDITAIVSWLRAQAPVASKIPDYELGLFGKVVALRLAPRVATPPAHVPEGEISLARGEYLAKGPAFCAGCHTPMDPLDGFVASGPAFSGEAEPQEDPTDPTQEIIAPNLTPDPETGHIATWSEDTFVGRFRIGRIIRGSKMPWEAYARLTEQDLRSIYRYLRTVPPVRREIGLTVRGR
jgi:mono/diheme cytochrome c family protein